MKRNKSNLILVEYHKTLEYNLNWIDKSNYNNNEFIETLYTIPYYHSTWDRDKQEPVLVRADLYYRHACLLSEVL